MGSDKYHVREPQGYPGLRKNLSINYIKNDNATLVKEFRDLEHFTGMNYKLQRAQRESHNSCGGVRDGDRRENVYNCMEFRV